MCGQGGGNACGGSWLRRARGQSDYVSQTPRRSLVRPSHRHHHPLPFRPRHPRRPSTPPPCRVSSPPRPAGPFTASEQPYSFVSNPYVSAHGGMQFQCRECARTGRTTTGPRVYRVSRFAGTLMEQDFLVPSAKSAGGARGSPRGGCAITSRCASLAGGDSSFSRFSLVKVAVNVTRKPSN